LWFSLSFKSRFLTVSSNLFALFFDARESSARPAAPHSLKRESHL
jgi:hypothetical protein